MPSWGAQIVLDMQGRFDGQVYISSAFLEWIGPDEVGGQAELIEGSAGRATPMVTRRAAKQPSPTGSSSGRPTPIFSAHFYDCLMVVVLAAQAAQNNDPTVYVDEIVGITGPPGTKCSRFADCMSLLAAGDEIDYDGASGPLDFVSNGEPGAAFFDIVTLDAEGRQSLSSKC